MKSKTMQIVTVCVYVVLFLGLTGYVSGQTARGKARQSGLVVDQEGNPVVEAKVTLEYMGDDERKRSRLPWPLSSQS